MFAAILSAKAGDPVLEADSYAEYEGEEGEEVRARCPQPWPCTLQSCQPAACPPCSRQVSTALAGMQAGGKVLACFLLSERDNIAFQAGFHDGILA